jgi:hypothetical protein
VAVVRLVAAVAVQQQQAEQLLRQAATEFTRSQAAAISLFLADHWMSNI